MAEKKTQHFVPQFYLRNFAIDENRRRVRGINLNSLTEISSAKLRTQCAKGYFYGKDLEVENLLGPLESKLAGVIRATINQPFSVNNNGKYALRLFAILQYLRTEALVKEYDRAFEWIAQALEGTVEGLELDAENKAVRNIEQLIHLAHEASDLKVQVLNAPRDAYFVTSDNPSVTFNKFSAQNFENSTGAGFGSSGFCIWLPLSFNVGVLVFDPSVYSLNPRLLKMPVLKKADVISLNQLIILNAQNMLYLSNSQNLKAISDLIDVSLPERAKPKSKTIYLKEVEQEENGYRSFTVILDEQTGEPITEQPKETCVVHTMSQQRVPKKFPPFLKTKITARALIKSERCPERKRKKFYYTEGFEFPELIGAIQKAKPFDHRPLKLTPLGETES